MTFPSSVTKSHRKRQRSLYTSLWHPPAGHKQWNEDNCATFLWWYCHMFYPFCAYVVLCPHRYSCKCAITSILL